MLRKIFDFKEKKKNTYLNLTNSSLAAFKRFTILSVRSEALSNLVFNDRPFFSNVDTSSLDNTLLPVRTT